MEREAQLLDILNDGGFHSGADLAVRLAISRAAIWKLISGLRERGVEVFAVPGKGYQLADRIELLDHQRIFSALEPTTRSVLDKLEIHRQIDSTNSYLMQRAKDGQTGLQICLAEQQLAGRGRRNRPWSSPFGSNVYLSILQHFELSARQLSGLSLAVGVAVAQVLHAVGVTDIKLKWPNDLLWQERKLGGILLEFGGEADGPAYVVAGLGLNIAMPRNSATGIDQAWTDLRSILGPQTPSRNALATRLINALIAMFQRFAHSGLTNIAADWNRYDITRNRNVYLQLPNHRVYGIGRGVDADGALLLETDQGLQRFIAGEISLRLNP